MGKAGGQEFWGTKTESFPIWIFSRANFGGPKAQGFPGISNQFGICRKTHFQRLGFPFFGGLFPNGGPGPLGAHWLPKKGLGGVGTQVHWKRTAPLGKTRIWPPKWTWGNPGTPMLGPGPPKVYSFLGVGIRGPNCWGLGEFPWPQIGFSISLCGPLTLGGPGIPPHFGRGPAPLGNFGGGKTRGFGVKSTLIPGTELNWRGKNLYTGVMGASNPLLGSGGNYYPRGGGKKFLAAAVWANSGVS